jgi:hypothetical protein
VEEGKIFCQELVHRLDVERLHATNLHADHERDRQTPGDLPGTPQPGERHDVRREIRCRHRLVARERAEQPCDDERRRVERHHIANRRQQERRYRNASAPADLGAVASDNESQRLAQTLGVADVVGEGRHMNPGLESATQKERGHHLRRQVMAPFDF